MSPDPQPPAPIIDELAIVKKSAREQTGEQAQRALWRAIKKFVRSRAYADGFVDWRAVEADLDQGINDSQAPATPIEKGEKMNPYPPREPAASAPLPKEYRSGSTHPEFDEWWMRFGERLSHDARMSMWESVRKVAFAAWAVAWDRAQREPTPSPLKERARTLAMLALQGERYSDDLDYQDAVDNVLALTVHQQPRRRPPGLSKEASCVNAQTDGSTQSVTPQPSAGQSDATNSGDGNGEPKLPERMERDATLLLHVTKPVTDDSGPDPDPFAEPEGGLEARLRQGCVCHCCDHSEGSDCACDCHSNGACAYGG